MEAGADARGSLDAAPPNEAGADAATNDASDASAAIDAANPLDSAVADAADAAPVDAAPVDPGAPYDQSVFMATHNSYSGGDRGAIAAQLDEGVRFIEFDIHDDNFATLGDYQLGHDNPGNQVAVGAPNPTTLVLRDWLGVVASWSAAHPTHAPIALALDLKSDLTDNTSGAAGNLGALNAIVASALGPRLLAARDVPVPWPGVNTMRGRVIVILSGDEGTRKAYRLDAASVPSVAVNAAGNVIEVHQSSKGDLWLWTGVMSGGGVRWSRHAKLGKGNAPAVALSDSGMVVLAYESGSGNLSYRVGALGANLDVTWQDEAALGKGSKPSLRFVNGGPTLRAIWNPSSGSGTMSLGGALDPSAPQVHWDAAGVIASTDARFDTMRDERSANSGKWISVRTGADGLAGSDTLLYATATLATDRVRYDQIAFVEHQKGGDALLEQESRVYAAAAKETAWLGSVRNSGRVVRGWQFDDVTQAASPPSNFPATDAPAAAWYITYTQQLGAVK